MRDFFSSRILFSLLILVLTSCGGNSAGSDSAGGDPTYVALGASDATGIGAIPITKGYVYLIEDGLEQKTKKPFTLYNLGIPGADIGDIKNIETQILRIETPDVITLFTGANDLISGARVDGFEADLRDLLSQLRSTAPNAILAIATLPNLTQLERFRNNPDPDVTLSRVQAYNAAIARQASAFNALLVDLYNQPLNDSLVSDIDGFHPSNAGHQAIANAFLRVLDPYTARL